MKVLVEGEPYSLVECHDADGETTKIVGYVLTDSLYFDGTLPVNPYLELAVSLKRDAFLYADRLCTEKLTKLFYNDKTRTTPSSAITATPTTPRAKWSITWNSSTITGI